MDNSSVSATRILEAFVVRARRIEAHSLVKSGRVSELTVPSLNISVSYSVASVTHMSRPEDEEVFESLAARVRPCTLASEDVQIKKVCSAIRTLAGESGLSEQQYARLRDIDRWYDRHISDQTKEYAAIAYRKELEGGGSLDEGPQDGLNGKVIATDARLGRCWLYADLVHNDPRKDIEDALEFSYDSRYEAGVVLVSHIAIKILDLLEIIRNLVQEEIIELGPDIWKEQVVAGGGPRTIERVSAYVGTINESDPEEGELNGFAPLTPEKAIEILHPEQRASLVITDAQTGLRDILRGYYDIRGDRLTVHLGGKIIIVLDNPFPLAPETELSVGAHIGSCRIIPLEGHEEDAEPIIERALSSSETLVVLAHHPRPLALKYTQSEVDDVD